MSGRWFRFYAEAMRNPKVARLSDKQFRLWVQLLAVASENEGKIPSIDDLKLILNRRLDHLLTGVKELLSAGLIDQLGDGYEPHNWNKFQYKSDTSNERVAKFRAKRNVTVTATETETESEENTVVFSKSASARSFPKPDDVDQSVWDDFCAHRRRKKANITETAMRAIAKQAGVAGWSLNDALIESVSRGWIGFKAEWVQGNGNGTNYNQSNGGPVDPMVQAHLAREARRAGQQQAFFGDDADSWAEVGAGASGVF